MATVAKENKLDPMTTAVERKVEKNSGPRVQIFLPALEDPGESGIKVDQYEHVTLANEEGDKVYYVKRGEHVEVPIDVFMILKQKYPNL